MAFSGLFRLGALFKFKVKFVEIVSKHFCIVSLLHTKARRGTESVVIRDQTVIQLLAWIIKGRGPDEFIFKCSYRTLGTWLRKFVAWIDVPDDRFTGHGFRRGGATRFSSCMKTTTEHSSSVVGPMPVLHAHTLTTL